MPGGAIANSSSPKWSMRNNAKMAQARTGEMKASVQGMRMHFHQHAIFSPRKKVNKPVPKMIAMPIAVKPPGRSWNTLQPGNTAGSIWRYGGGEACE